MLDEPDEWVWVQYNAAFYLLKKDPHYLLKVIDAVFSEDYQVGCSAVNTLKELINDQNKKLILDALTKKLLST